MSDNQHTMTFKLTPEQFAAKKVELEKHDVHITNNEGVIDHSGFAGSYHYDQEAQVLTLNITHEPHIPFVNVDKKIKEWFSAS